MVFLLENSNRFIAGSVIEVSESFEVSESDMFWNPSILNNYNWIRSHASVDRGHDLEHPIQSASTVAFVFNTMGTVVYCLYWLLATTHE